MKKAIIGVVIAIVLVAVVGIGVLVVNDFRQEDILRQEMLEFENLTRAENIDLDQIDQRIRELKTTGDYGVLEKAMKDYLADVVNTSVSIANIINDERIVNALTPENYTEDGPDFVQTKQFLEQAKSDIEQYKTEVLTLLTNEGAMSYIEDKNLDQYYIDLYEDKNLDQYYIDLYKEIALSEDTAIEESNTELENSLDEMMKLLDVETQIINFLSENKDGWEIQGENIIFNNQTLQDQYNEYISQIQ